MTTAPRTNAFVQLTHVCVAVLLAALGHVAHGGLFITGMLNGSKINSYESTTYGGIALRHLAAETVGPDGDTNWSTPMWVGARTSDDAHDRVVYSVFWGANGGDDDGGLSAYHVDAKTGKFKMLGSPVSTCGSAPAHFALSASSNHGGGGVVFVANYGSGSVGVLQTSNASGELLSSKCTRVQFYGHGSDLARQQSSHPHMVVLTQGTQHVYVPDLGLDRIWHMRWDEKAHRMRNHTPPFLKLPPKTGPRHLVFHPHMQRAYLASELSSTVSTLLVQADGSLKLVSTLPAAPASFTGINYPAEIVILPLARYVFVTNRGHDSIAQFEVKDGELQAKPRHTPSGGKTPYSLWLGPMPARREAAVGAPPAKSLAMLVTNSDSGTIASFTVVPESGDISMSEPNSAVAGTPAVVISL